VASSTVHNTYSNRTIFFGKFIGGIRGRMDYYFGDCINSTIPLHELRQNVHNRFRDYHPYQKVRGHRKNYLLKNIVAFFTPVHGQTRNYSIGIFSESQP